MRGFVVSFVCLLGVFTLSCGRTVQYLEVTDPQQIPHAFVPTEGGKVEWSTHGANAFTINPVLDWPCTPKPEGKDKVTCQFPAIASTDHQVWVYTIGSGAAIPSTASAGGQAPYFAVQVDHCPNCPPNGQLMVAQLARGKTWPAVVGCSRQTAQVVPTTVGPVTAGDVINWTVEGTATDGTALTFSDQRFCALGSKLNGQFPTCTVANPNNATSVTYTVSNVPGCTATSSPFTVTAIIPTPQ